MHTYTRTDCDQIGYDFSLKNKVVVLAQSALPDDHPGQLFYCTGGNGTNANPIGRSLFLVSLSTGEQHQFCRSDVIGTLKPEPARGCKAAAIPNPSQQCGRFKRPCSSVFWL